MTKRFLPTKRTEGGNLLGYITCSYATLVRAFGEPTKSDGYKTSSEWSIIDVFTGRTLSIYDYKQTNMYDSSCPSVQTFREQPSAEWHIGGIKRPDFDALREFILSFDVE